MKIVKLPKGKSYFGGVFAEHYKEQKDGFFRLQMAGVDSLGRSIVVSHKGEQYAITLESFLTDILEFEEQNG